MLPKIIIAFETKNIKLEFGIKKEKLSEHRTPGAFIGLSPDHNASYGCFIRLCSNL